MPISAVRTTPRALAELSIFKTAKAIVTGVIIPPTVLIARERKNHRKFR